MDEEALVKDMNALSLPGVVFRPMTFTPMFNKHEKQICRGAELHITDRDAYRPFETMLHMFRHFKKYPEFTVRESGLALRLGQDLLAGDFDPVKIAAKAVDDSDRFCENVEKYRIYR